MKRYFLYAAMAMMTAITWAQDDHVKFNAVSRTLQQNNQMTEEDSVNNDRNSSGYTQMDLGVNINPDRKTEIQSILRFKTDMGGFFGEGTEIELRQIRVAGVVKDFVGYEVGDIYLQLSPFTLHNSEAEGQVNEATVFSDLRRDIAQYENFNQDNFWWQQGAHVDFGLAFDENATQIHFDGFFLRNRGTDFVSVPSSFYTGGRVKVQPSKSTSFTLNYIDLYDDGATINTTEAKRNPVTTLEATYGRKLGKWDLQGALEAGMAKLIFTADEDADSLVQVSLPDGYEDIFFDAGIVATDEESGLAFQLGYRYVGPEFFSAGAQSKRINYDRTPTVFAGVNNNPFDARAITLFDLTRDDQIYNPVITHQLMAYDPRLSNAMPYGVATPNRQGVNYAATYTSKEKVAEVKLTGALLSDAVGEGSTEKRSFMINRIGANLAVNELLEWNKKITLKAGIQLESTSRDDSIGVDLKSSLVDAGLDVEIAKNFELLGGVKLLSSAGNEFYYTRDEYNELGTGTQLDIDQSQVLMGLGIKYNFNERIYLTAQSHSFQYKDKHEDAAEGADYGFNQFFLLFNMKI